MDNVLDEIEKGIIVEVEDVKQAINVDKIAHAVLIREFDVDFIDDVIDALSIPVIASCRIGHFVEAQILEKTGVKAIDESNPTFMKHINKKNFSVPFICMVREAEEVSARIEEGAYAVRTEFGNIDEITELIEKIKEKNEGARIIPSLKIATPADISLLFKKGCHSIIISSDIFSSPNPPKLLDALVKSARYYNDIEKIFSFSKNISKILPFKAK